LKFVTGCPIFRHPVHFNEIKHLAGKPGKTNDATQHISYNS